MSSIDAPTTGVLAADHLAEQIAELVICKLEDAAAANPPRIPFGAGPTDTMPAEWAGRGLTWLHDAFPVVFARMMMAITGIDPELMTAPQRSHKRGAGNGQGN